MINRDFTVTSLAKSMTFFVGAQSTKLGVFLGAAPGVHNSRSLPLSVGARAVRIGPILNGPTQSAGYSQIVNNSRSDSTST
jgi:hypothetical protein